MFIFLYNGSCLCTFIHYTFSNFGREILICAIKCRQPYRVLANFCNAYLGRRVCTPPPQQNQGPWSCLMFTMRTEGEGFARHHHSKVRGYNPGCVCRVSVCLAGCVWLCLSVYSLSVYSLSGCVCLSVSVCLRQAHRKLNGLNRWAYAFQIESLVWITKVWIPNRKEHALDMPIVKKPVHFLMLARV
jgi:hypothetical protein